MRSAIASFALLTAFAIPAAAHADTFSLTSGGNSTTFSLTGAPTGSQSLMGVGAETFFNGVSTTVNGVVGPTNVAFYNSSMFTNSSTFPSLDLVIGGTVYSGSTLYGGTVTSPTFGPGTFSLQQIVGGALTGPVITLNIDGGATQGAPAITPEPSSFVFLGTGLVGIAGMARRRFFARS